MIESNRKVEAGLEEKINGAGRTVLPLTRQSTKLLGCEECEQRNPITDICQPANIPLPNTVSH